jgi:type II secretion system protein J
MASRRQHGYTLIEVLVAMIMFAFISAATTVSLNAALRGQQAAQYASDALADARAALGTMSRDLRAAYASQGNPNTLFVASRSMSGTLLRFSSRAHRILPLPTDSNGNVDTTSSRPQSDVAVIQYSFDPNSGLLTRDELTTPNVNALPQPGAPGTAIAHRVQSISFQFYDPDQGMRTDWNLMAPPPGSTGATGAASSMLGGDTYLPQTVQISLAMVGGDGAVRSYTTTVFLVTSTPQDAGQKPETAATTGGTGGAAGTGPNTGGANNTGGADNTGGANQGGGGGQITLPPGGSLPAIPTTPMDGGRP